MKILNIVFIALLLATASCTDNQKARSFGGTETVALQPNHVLINATWKDEDLWILTKDTTTGQIFFNEKSSFGILEGSIFFEASQP